MAESLSTRVFLWGIGGVVGAATASLFALLVLFPWRLMALFVMLAQVALLFSVNQFLLVRHRRPSALLLSLTLLVALFGLFLIIGAGPLQWLMVILAGTLYGGLFTAALFRKTLLQHGQKRIRRIMTMYWIFSLYGLLATLFALVVFFPDLPSFLVALFGGVVSGLIAWFLWREYVGLGFRQGLLWIVVLSLATAELMTVIFFLPSGYLQNALFVVWPWYVAQLLLRFSFTRQGVLWPRQLVFFLANAGLYAAVLLWFVRWN